MEMLLVCPECLSAHTDPEDAALGHRIRCRDCALLLDVATALIQDPGNQNEPEPLETSLAA